MGNNPPPRWLERAAIISGGLTLAIIFMLIVLYSAILFALENT